MHSLYAAEGLIILGFPCNQFGSQEPGTNEEIKEFVTQYDVEFQLMDKIEVNGKGAHPLFKWLKSQKSGTLGSSIKWNFTKFLIDPRGTVVKRYGPPRAPSSMTPLIRELLVDAHPAL